MAWPGPRRGRAGKCPESRAWPATTSPRRRSSWWRAPRSATPMRDSEALVSIVTVGLRMPPRWIIRYRVAFRKRFSPEGEPADDPKSLVSVMDGVIEDEEFVEIIEPAGLGV